MATPTKITKGLDLLLVKKKAFIQTRFFARYGQSYRVSLNPILGFLFFNIVVLFDLS